MGKPTGFLEIERHDRKYEPVAERLKTWNEFVQPLPQPEVRAQAAAPAASSAGCPPEARQKVSRNSCACRGGPQPGPGLRP